MALVIGLTGNIATGKSTVAALCAERGAEVIDSDRLVRELTAPGTPGLAAVVERFGPAVLTPDGALDRARLARRVFADPAELAALEAILHPLVRRRRDELLAGTTAAVVVVEAVKLIEAGFHRDCDAVWLVVAPAELALRRLIDQRGMSEESARARLAAQPDDSPTRALADQVIVNDGDLAALAARVDAAWSETV